MTTTLFFQKNLLLLFLISIPSKFVYSQIIHDSTAIRYNEIFTQISEIQKLNVSFKDAVFLTEVAYKPYMKDDNYYFNFIAQYSKLINKYSQGTRLSSYRQKDSLNYISNTSLSTFMSGEISIMRDSLEIYSLPFTYNFTDPQGNQDWTNTFVTKLLGTHKGNCRSLTYLYKILADELGAKCWLALAPNHIYIRNYSKQIGWYNTELTSGTFPTDAWIAATGYVNTDAIRSGVYMDTLSNQQSIGLCIMDLAQGYIKQTNNYTDSFVLKCCNLVLQYHSVNPEALLTKAEALKRMYLKQKEENNLIAQTTYNEMEQTYITLVKLGYREMPYKTDQKWLKTAKQDKEKYQNQQLKAILNKH
jgi:hypothetical protein